MARPRSLLAAAALLALLQAPAARAQAPAAAKPAAKPAPAAADAAAPEARHEPALMPAEAAAVLDDLLAKIRRRGVLRVGISNTVPWGAHDKDGKLVGFEVDLATQLADDLGVRAEIVPVAHAEALADLATGRFDLVLRVPVTPARALVAYFSQPLLVSSTELVANRLKAGARKTVAEFDSPDVSIGIRKGTTVAELTKRTFPKAKLVEFDDDVARFEALNAGKVTATVAVSAVPGFVAARWGKDLSTPLAAPLTRRAQAMAVRPSDADFLRYLDAWITARTLDGFIPARTDAWFKDLSWAEKM